MTDEEKEYGIRCTFNSCSHGYFESMPGYLREAIAAVQSLISRRVLQACSGAKATSGVRCPCENDRVGGKPHSRHLWGCARDFAPHPDFPCSIPGCKVIIEPNCIHVELEDGY